MKIPSEDAWFHFLKHLHPGNRESSGIRLLVDGVLAETEAVDPPGGRYLIRWNGREVMAGPGIVESGEGDKITFSNGGADVEAEVVAVRAVGFRYSRAIMPSEIAELPREVLDKAAALWEFDDGMLVADAHYEHEVCSPIQPAKPVWTHAILDIGEGSPGWKRLGWILLELLKETLERHGALADDRFESGNGPLRRRVMGGELEGGAALADVLKRSGAGMMLALGADEMDEAAVVVAAVKDEASRTEALMNAVARINERKGGAASVADFLLRRFKGMMGKPVHGKATYWPTGDDGDGYVSMYAAVLVGGGRTMLSVFVRPTALPVPDSRPGRLEAR